MMEKIAFQAEFDFFEWRVDNESAPLRLSWRSIWNGSIAASPVPTATRAYREQISAPHG